jgi:hypothetical protein
VNAGPSEASLAGPGVITLTEEEAVVLDADT